MKDPAVPLRNNPDLEAIRQRVQKTGISEPPIWRKGPRPVIRQGETCFVMSFEEDWPNVTILPALVRGVDLIGRIYIVTIKGRLRSVASERIFATREAAEQEALVHAAVNWNCFESVPSDDRLNPKWNTDNLHEEM